MRPLVQKLPLSKNSSFLIDKFITPYFETPWHYHTEYEITLVLHGKGKRFVGNHVGDFTEGDLVFLGPNLPHWFRKENNEDTGGTLVIHFQEDFLGQAFPHIPEMQKILQLFDRSKMGVLLNGSSREMIAQQMNTVYEAEGMHRLVALLQLFTTLADTDEYELLSSPDVSGQNARDSDRLNKVFEYVMNHFTENIHLEKVAEIANMSYSGFCRYFKNRTKKNFSHFVNEIRIGYACQRLMESDVSVSSVCYECGFNNLTNFNEQFKKIIKLTPHQFKMKSKL